MFVYNTSPVINFLIFNFFPFCFKETQILPDQSFVWQRNAGIQELGVEESDDTQQSWLEVVGHLLRSLDVLGAGVIVVVGRQVSKSIKHLQYR